MLLTGTASVLIVLVILFLVVYIPFYLLSMKSKVDIDVAYHKYIKGEHDYTSPIGEGPNFRLQEMGKRLRESR
jgi:hypothetical protein